jgi:hypothetical protein
VCPHGAMCPGGFRAWPLHGYYTPSEASGTILECPAPTGRCTGWDVISGLSTCGVGYQDGSYLCMACGEGFYTAVDGTCTACPADIDVGATLTRLLTFASIVFGTLVVLYLLCVLSLRVLGANTRNLTTTFMNLVVWTFLTLQIVGQVGKTASTGLPPTVRSMYEALLVFQFEGATIPAACTGADPMLTQTILCACVFSVLVLLACVYGAASCSPSLSQYVQSYKVVGFLLKGFVVLLSVSYAPVVNNLLQVVACTSSTIPVRAYLAMRQDGATLAAAGVGLPAHPSRFQLDTLITVPLLDADPSQVCYESQHASVYPLAVMCLLCYVFLYPLAIVYYVTTTVKTIHPPTHQNLGPIALRHRVLQACCGVCPVACGASTVKPPSQSQPLQQQHTDVVDSDPDILNHVLLRPFTNAQFRASFVGFLILDAWLQCALAAIGILWRYTTTTNQTCAKATVLCGALLFAAWLYESRRPFRVGRGWKTHVKAFSLVLCAIGAVENALLTESPPSDDGTVSDTVSGWSFLLVAATVLLLLVLAVAFVASLFAEQKLQVVLFKLNVGISNNNDVCGCTRQKHVAVIAHSPAAVRTNPVEYCRSSPSKRA